MTGFDNLENLPSVQVDEFLPPISLWTRLGGLTLVGIFGSAIALISVIQYSVTVQAPATIRPTGELRLIQAGMEGRITNVFVKENQQVKSGDILATLDDSRLQTQKSHLQNQIKSANLQLTQIKAQLQTFEIEKEAEIIRNQRLISSAQAELNRSQRQYRDNKLNIIANIEEAQANVNVAEQEWQKALLELKAAQANLKAIEAALNVAQAKFDRYQLVAKEGAFSQDQLEEAKLSVEQQRQSISAQLATVEAYKKIVKTRQEEIKVARARLQRTQINLNPSQADVAIAKAQIAQTTATGKINLATLNRQREDLIQKQIEFQQQLTTDQRSLQQIEKELTQTNITAMTEGTIVFLKMRNPSQTIQVGETLAQIIPNQVSLVIKAAVSPQDISKVKRGQIAQMRVSACPYSDYGTLKGTVSQISQDTIRSDEEPVTPSSNRQNNAFYEVIIKPHHFILSQKNHFCTIQMGMEGEAHILSQKETVFQFLLRKIRLISNW
jgi:HlyD family secretion protein